jgi:trk system potassium uptake protein
VIRDVKLAPPKKLRRRFLHPARVVFAGFLLVTLVGTALLTIPYAKVGPGGAALDEAFFTAVSAITVTGLIVVDTPVYWSGFGQAVILVLIQIGGFGVMVLATLIAITVARRLSLQARMNAAAETKSYGQIDVRAIILNIVRISLLFEGVAAIVLLLWFWLHYGYSIGDAAWLGVFHSISAFNNAGFSLFSDNLMSYVGDPVVSLTLCALIIVGGVGFPVIMQLHRYWGTPRKWTMNTRIVIAATLLLLPVGTIYITAIEWNNPATLGPLDWPVKILAGFFQSVQTRTAGFNSIDIGATDGATQFGMIALMFIGGGSAGTAGGIKVTTFAVLLFIVIAEIRGDGVVNVFGKRLSRAVHRQAISVVILAVGVIVAGTVVIMIETGLPLGPVLFESVSAFSTVGLSTGITTNLPILSQLILCLLMFIGRLGPITFASALALRERGILYQLPKERPLIG